MSRETVIAAIEESQAVREAWRSAVLWNSPLGRYIEAKLNEDVVAKWNAGMFQ